jgi:AIG2-like family
MKNGGSISMTLVFQYGSNASVLRLNSEDRLRGDAQPIGIAYTDEDFELDFTVWSQKNKCAAADIIQGSGRKIWGVLYDIPDYLIHRETSQGRRSLDAIEGEGANYERISIRVREPNGQLVDDLVITYVVKSKVENLRTNLQYASYIIKGLREQNVPTDYIEYVKQRVKLNNSDINEEIDQI